MSKTLPITERTPVREGRSVNASAGYDGPTPSWVCPHCGTSNRAATLEPVRPADVADVCTCGAEANPTYEEATR